MLKENERLYETKCRELGVSCTPDQSVEGSHEGVEIEILGLVGKELPGVFASVERVLRSERMEKFVSYYETFSQIQSALE